MTGLFHVDQATADRWRADGRFVLFGEGEWCSCDSVPSTDNLGGHTHPPAWMAEAAKPCETCGGDPRPSRSIMRMAYGMPARKCPDCSNGQRRHPVTVPCEWCAEDGWLLGDPDHYERGTDAWIACDCNPNGDDPHDGRISTGLLAVVEFGPLPIGDIDAECPATDHLYVDWATIGGHRHVFLARCTHGDVTDEEWSLPPDVDPASLVGQWAIGGRIEVAG